MAESKSDKVPINSTVKRVASVDELDVETFTTIPGTLFSVRQLDYVKSKMKGLSDESLLTVYGIDIFKTKKKVPKIMERIQWPTDLPKIEKDEKDGFWVPELFIVNVMLPNYAPSNPIWGPTKDDGDNYSFVLYLTLNQAVYDGMKKDASAAHSLLKKFFQMDPTSKADYDLRGRLKGIPVLLNPDDVSLGLLRTPVSMYNSKPFLTGPKYHSFVKTDKYLEVDVDIHRYIYAARSTFFGMVPEIEKMLLDFGIVVEGRDDSELPEQMLGAVRISKLKFTTARELDV